MGSGPTRVRWLKPTLNGGGLLVKYINNFYLFIANFCHAQEANPSQPAWAQLNHHSLISCENLRSGITREESVAICESNYVPWKRIFHLSLLPLMNTKPSFNCRIQSLASVSNSTIEANFNILSSPQTLTFGFSLNLEWKKYLLNHCWNC